jgi:hypothetical protein
MSTKIITSSVTLEKVQYSIVQATIMQTNKGPLEVKPTHVDSSILTLTIVMVTGGEFDQSKAEALLMAINEKLKEIEL